MIFWNWSYLIVVSKTAFCVVIASLFLTSCAVPPTKPVSQAPKVSSPSSLSRTSKVTETVVTDDSSSSAALTPVEFSEIPGWDEDKLSEAWQAWLQSCDGEDYCFEYDFTNEDWREDIGDEEVLDLLESEYESWKEWQDEEETEEEEKE